MEIKLVKKVTYILLQGVRVEMQNYIRTGVQNWFIRVIEPKDPQAACHIRWEGHPPKLSEQKAIIYIYSEKIASAIIKRGKKKKLWIFILLRWQIGGIQRRCQESYRQS